MSENGEAFGRPSDEEALKLTLAFYCIMEARKRTEVLALAQQFARESGRVDGVPHYTELDQGDGSKH